MAKRCYLSRKDMRDIRKALNQNGLFAGLPSQPLTSEERESLLSDELNWKELKFLDLRPCMSCGELFEVTADRAIFSRSDQGGLPVHICPECAHEAMTVLCGSSHEEIDMELSSSLEDSPDLAHDYSAWQPPYEEGNLTNTITY